MLKHFYHAVSPPEPGHTGRNYADSCHPSPRAGAVCGRGRPEAAHPSPPGATCLFLKPPRTGPAAPSAGHLLVQGCSQTTHVPAAPSVGGGLAHNCPVPSGQSKAAFPVGRAPGVETHLASTPAARACPWSPPRPDCGALSTRPCRPGGCDSGQRGTRCTGLASLVGLGFRTW